MSDPRTLAERVKEKATRNYGTRRRPCSPTEAIALANALLAAEQEIERLREACERLRVYAEQDYRAATGPEDDWPERPGDHLRARAVLQIVETALASQPTERRQG